MEITCKLFSDDIIDPVGKKKDWSHTFLVHVEDKGHDVGCDIASLKADVQIYVNSIGHAFKNFMEDKINGVDQAYKEVIMEMEEVNKLTPKDVKST